QVNEATDSYPQNYCRRLDWGVEDPRAESGGFRRLVDTYPWDEPRIWAHPRISRQHAGHIDPDLDQIHIERGTSQRVAVGGAGTLEGGRYACGGRADEAAEDRDPARRHHPSDSAPYRSLETIHPGLGLGEGIVRDDHLTGIDQLCRDPTRPE